MTWGLTLYIICICQPVGRRPNCSKIDARTSIFKVVRQQCTALRAVDITAQYSLRMKSFFFYRGERRVRREILS